MKMVIVVDRELPVGLIANTTAVLGISLGCMVEDMLGGDVYDGGGGIHRGLTKHPIPILGGTRDQIKQLRDKVYTTADGVEVVDFCQVAQKSLDYDTYSTAMAAVSGDELTYLGLGLFGPEKKINKLTGSIGLLR